MNFTEKLFGKRKKASFTGYDYSTVYDREDTVQRLLSYASMSKQDICEYWKKMRSYYDGNHASEGFSSQFTLENNIPFKAAVSSDGYIHVESQIDATIPEFEFSPRGNDDSEKAKQREKVVRYICDTNDLEYKNSRNERNLGILGTAIWKVCWDSSKKNGSVPGEVVIDNPSPFEIYPDPSAKNVDECEYIGYVYSMHREKARRIFEKELSLRGISFDELVYSSDSGKHIYLDCENDEFSYKTENDTVRITEWWFRQTQDGTSDIECYCDGKTQIVHYDYKAGDIGLILLIGNTEVRYIPKYWRNTDCDMFPFVVYDRLPSESSIWGKSELEAIIPFIDAADREIVYAQLNSMYSSNDIIVAEENALCEDCEFDNSPGAVWKLRPGMMGKVQRLGNASYTESYLHSNFDKWRYLMEQTTGNFTINQGNEPERVTTATGIAILNERAKNRGALKKIDKSVGFARLFELCDRTALEYYDDGRVIYTGAADKDSYVFRYENYLVKDNENSYVPRVDVRIHIGDGLANSKAFTISAISSLISTPITADNYKIVKSYLELIDLPMRKEICDMLDEKFASTTTAGEEDFSQLLSALEDELKKEEEGLNEQDEEYNIEITE